MSGYVLYWHLNQTFKRPNVEEVVRGRCQRRECCQVGDCRLRFQNVWHCWIFLGGELRKMFSYVLCHIADVVLQPALFVVTKSVFFTITWDISIRATGILSQKVMCFLSLNMPTLFSHNCHETKWKIEHKIVRSCNITKYKISTYQRNAENSNYYIYFGLR